MIYLKEIYSEVDFAAHKRMRLFFPGRQGLQRKWPPASQRRGASREKKPGKGHCSGKPGPAGGRARDRAAASGGGRRKVQENRMVCVEERCSISVYKPCSGLKYSSRAPLYSLFPCSSIKSNSLYTLKSLR